MRLNDYPVTLQKYKVYNALPSYEKTYTLCEKCLPKFIDELDTQFGYNFSRLVDYGSCSICGINTVKKHIYLKSQQSKGK